jgi:hypothetical protein
MEIPDPGHHSPDPALFSGGKLLAADSIFQDPGLFLQMILYPAADPDIPCHIPEGSGSILFCIRREKYQQNSDPDQGMNGGYFKHFPVLLLSGKEPQIPDFLWDL